MQIFKQTSISSDLSYWVGLFGLPSMTASILLHRIGAIESSSLGISLLILSILGIIGVLASLHGFSLLLRGMTFEIKNCVMGLILSCTLLLPAGVTLVGATQHPPLNDITTDFNYPPSIIIGAKQIDGPGQYENRMQQEAYPDIQHKLYDLNLNDAYQTAVAAAERMGWEIIFDRSRIQVDDVTWFQAQARTGLIGFVDDVSVRFQSVPPRVRLDVRSKSRFGRYDFGKNAERVREFIAIFEEQLE